ncbi:MAG: glycoside hydrolase family 5 protein [Treponema sp.]|jgi:endoglucanase|nr:glycoside hydrolase family 5 protein [Treponema sp.]
MNKIFMCLITVALLAAACGTADHSSGDYVLVIPPPADVVRASLPFSRGVNFSGWLDASSPRAIPFTKYSEQDFKDVKSIGVDVIRLPLYLHNMTGGAPNYNLDPLFLKFMDQAVDWAEQYEIYLILDNHSFDPVAPTQPDIDKILIPVWTQLAGRYKDRSDYILYEILNEPHDIDAQLWADIQGRVIAAIRAVDTRHSIIVGGIWYNSIDALSNLPTYSYDNIIYTFHFYDPYLFTHQGETWGSPPNLNTLKGLPFPSDAHAMPQVPANLRGTWVENSMRQSYKQDATIQALAKQLDKTVKFSRERGDLPLFCGEFGVFMPNSLHEDRVRWYQVATKLLDDRGIARTSWDYFGGFGIFKTDRGGPFNSSLDIEIVTAMGFSPPPYMPEEKLREAFTVFDNYPAPLMDFTHYGCEVDLYHQNGEKYAINWKNANQYGAFHFNFRRGVDWEYLQSDGYAITFTAKADKPAHFQVRFIDREDADTLPWRIFAPVDIEADGQWHTIRIPLSSMREHGAWINATEQWLSPQGEFSWDKVATLAFVAEDHDLHGITVLFDTIKLEP